SFNASLSLFGGFKELGSNCTSGCQGDGTITDDEETPNVDSGCGDTMPLEGGCCFTPMSSFYNVAYDESGALGLVITSNYAPLTPYLTNVSEALFNDDQS